MSCDLNHGPDQRQILDAAAAMLETHYPVGRLRESRPDDLREIADFGAFSLALPEESGGAGFTLVEEALLHGLLGRHLFSTRALAASMAARLAAGLGRTDIVEQAISGEGTICAGVMSGDTLLLVEPEGAAYAVIFDQRRLALIDTSKLHLLPVESLGGGTPIARAHPGAVLGEWSAGEGTAIADLLVSAQLLGIAEAARDLAVSYAKIRQQFGRPIGAFQAIKHHCADMAVAAEMLSSLLDMAAIALRDRREDSAFQLAALRLLAPKVALANARTCIQIHGGIGFSDEADAHHFLKQAHILSRMGGCEEMLDLPAPLAPHDLERATSVREDAPST